MRLLVCGSRDWTDSTIIVTVLEGFLHEAQTNFEKLVVIEGCCPTGADLYAHHFYDGPCEAPGGGSHAGHLYVEHEHYPADWDQYGKSAGPIRNQQMLDQGKPDFVVAFSNQPLTKGTSNMVNKARVAGIHTWVVGH